MNLKHHLPILLFAANLANNIVLGQGVCHGQTVMLAEDGVCDYNSFCLVFEDNFEGSTLNLEKWQLQPWAEGSIGGVDYYTLNNVIVSNGTCKIWAYEDYGMRRAIHYLDDDVILSDGNPNLRPYHFTTSNIWSRHVFHHGYYEMRVKLPAGMGYFPAFRLYGRNGSINNEIDIFEFWSVGTVPQRHQMTVHYNEEMCNTNYIGPDFSADFHIFGLEWDNYHIKWYVDGEMVRFSPHFYTMLGQTVGCNSLQSFHTYVMDKVYPNYPMNIIFNLGIEAIAVNPSPLPDLTIFPNAMEIDYIKFYRKIDCDVIR